ESKFRPGQMEFRITGVMLLGEVKSKYTRRLALSLPLEKVDSDFVQFLQRNLMQYPGNCEIMIQVTGTEQEQNTMLRSTGGRLLVNDDLIEYLQTADILYKVETA